MVIQIDPEQDPEFDQIGPICQNTPAPDLPTTSLNGVTGSWDPSFIDTSADGVFTFIFTADPGQCALTYTMNIVIDEEVTPEFDPIPF